MGKSKKQVLLNTSENTTVNTTINNGGCLCFTAQSANSTIAMQIYNTPTLDQNFQTSANGIDWTEFIPGTTIITLSNIGDKVYFKGNNPNGINDYYQTYTFTGYGFVMTGTIAASGNIMSLIDNGACETLTIPNPYCYSSIFSGCSSLTTPPELPATTLTERCYASMFSGCNSLVSSPELPATTLTNRCYADMFSGCTSLIETPKLPATTLDWYCYTNMFYGCTSLTETPELPATTLVSGCYYSMFYGCTALVTTSALPAIIICDSSYKNMFCNCTSLRIIQEISATTIEQTGWDACDSMFKGCTSLAIAPNLFITTLGAYCCTSMFANCTSLITPPTLPATVMNSACYQSMFSGCASLITAPTLPATAMAWSCYNSMFSRCTSLTNLPELPAMRLAESCYQSMFSGCTSLTTLPALPATTLKYYCYDSMFSGCSNIKLSQSAVGYYTNNYRIPSTGYITEVLYAALNNMFSNTGGTFIGRPDINTIYYLWNATPLCFTANVDGSTVNMAVIGAPTLNQNFQYSVDTTTWTDFIPGTTTIRLAHVGDKVYFKGNNLNGVNESDSIYYQFVMTGSISASGTVMSLIDNAQYNIFTIPNQYCFAHLFEGCTSLTTPPLLAATTLTAWCYYKMFYNCTSLLNIPKLPATAMEESCYESMFYNCTSLIAATTVSVATLAKNCYNSMFANCSSLVEVPQLSTTSVSEGCYAYMFSNCTSLVSLPTLPATTLADMCCYSMFEGCTNIKLSLTAREYYIDSYRIPISGTGTSAVNAVTNMFAGTGGTLMGTPDINTTYYLWNETLCFTANTAHSTIAMTVNGNPTLNQNFQYSTDRVVWNDFIPGTTVITLAKIWDKVYFKGNNPNGINESTDIYYQFIMTGSMTASGNIMSLIDNAQCTTSVIPNNYCFTHMFDGCTALTSLPILSATTLSKGCYSYMFTGCTNIKLSQTSVNYYVQEYRIPILDTGISALDATTNMFANTGGLFVGTPEINRTYYLWNENNLYNYLCFTANSANSSVTLNGSASNWKGSYCLNYGEWIEYRPGITGTITLEHVGDTVRFKGIYTNNPSLRFSMDGSIAASGNIMSLCSGDNYATTTVLPVNECFKSLFENCTALTSAPLLPATTLTTSCYERMFSRCTSLSKAPKLPATTLVGSCYYYMFGNCTSLITSPTIIPTTIAKSWSCASMFSGCTSLTETPELPATTVEEFCYYYMFYACKSITIPPSLPALIMRRYCYGYMFNGCTSLKLAPALPATTLDDYCYYRMFADQYGKSGQYFSPPELPATELKNNCYSGMFEMVSSFPVYDTPQSSAYTTWKIPQSGLGNGNYTMSNMFGYIAGTRATDSPNFNSLQQTYYIPGSSSWYYDDRRKGAIYYQDANDALCLTANSDETVITLNKIGSPSWTGSYSYDGYSWVHYSEVDNLLFKIILHNIGDKVYIKGTLASANSTSNYLQFSIQGSAAASGNIMSLCNENNYKTNTTIPYNYAFYRLFYNCSALISMPDLTATTLKPYCYTEMFKGCTGLTKVNILPATALTNNCYESMFANCTSLQTTQETLPATSLAAACCKSMFEGCTQLTQSFVSLPVSRLANECYKSMFNGCSLLSKVPELPALTLAQECYSGMFQNCVSLTTLPKLPAIILANSCYYNMFNGCSNIKLADQLSQQYLFEYRIPSSGTGAIATSALDGMFSNTGGSFTGTPSINTTYYEHYRYTGLTFTARQANSTIALNKIGNPDWEGSYSLDGETWNEYPLQSSGIVITLNNIGDKVYFRGTYNSANTENDYIRFSMGGKIAASGNLMSLCNAGTFASVKAIPYNYMFNELFHGCSALVEAPDLPATILTEGCYKRTFAYTGITEAPQLPAINLTPNCYSEMFYHCTALVLPPDLPAQSMQSGCYAHMFANCTALLVTPFLNALELDEFCYQAMFRGCTSLTTITELPAIVLPACCYLEMFSGCTSLYISDIANYEYEQQYTLSSSGVCTTQGNLSTASMFKNCQGSRYTNSPDLTTSQKVYYTQNKPLHLWVDVLCFTAIEGDSTITLSGSTSIWSGQYSYNGYYWIDYTLGISLPLPNINDKIYFKGTSTSWGLRFYMTGGKIAASGNIMSLCSGDNFATVFSIPYSCMFEDLFDSCTQLTEPPKLPATTLQWQCYRSMFNGCTSLTVAPELPATQISGSRWNVYQNMFSGCTSLTKAPELVAINVTNTYALYYCMFKGCTSLTQAPSILPRKVVGEADYGYMFSGCVSLTTPPIILAEEFEDADNAIGMFEGCISLTAVPELPSTALVAGVYNRMFSGCTSLYISDVPTAQCDKVWKIPTAGIASGGSASTDMFKNCLGTRSTDSPNFNGTQIIYYTQNAPIALDYLTFTANTANSTIQLCNDELSVSPVVLEYSVNGGAWTNLVINDTIITLNNIGDKVCLRGDNNTFNTADTWHYFQMNGSIAVSGNIMSLLNKECIGTTISQEHMFEWLFDSCPITTAPKLPATTLADYCYASMFTGCSDLIEAPELPAMELCDCCYEDMFSYCTSLTTIPELLATNLADGCYKFMFDECTSLGNILTSLPATTLYNECYLAMFRRCTSLDVNSNSEEIISLPAKILTYNCYCEMFSGCSSLSQTPLILATTLDSYCCSSMFLGCTNLTRISNLMATDISYPGCYINMFEGCTSLYISESMSSECTKQWIMPAFGIGTTDTDTTTYMLGDCAGSRVSDTPEFTNSRKIYYTQSEPLSILSTLCFTSTTINSSVTLNGIGNPHWNGEYSINYSTWVPYILGTTINLTNVGDQVYFRGQYEEGTHPDVANYLHFVLTGSAVQISGNIMSMCYGEEYLDTTILPCEYVFYNMFSNCDSLINIPQLPAIELTPYCYSYMFYNCKNLTSAGINDIPLLPASVCQKYCYSHMFDSCTQLASLLFTLDAENLAEGCYLAMFRNCKQLTQAPALPAIIVEPRCYMQMFYGCNNLITMPQLLAVHIKKQSYSYMFYGCESLVETRIFLAKDVEEDSCEHMFDGCSSLSQIPGLNSKELKDGCYQWMFNNCDDLGINNTTQKYKYQVPIDGDGIEYLYPLDNMFRGTNGNISIPKINTTYYTNNTIKYVPEYLSFLAEESGTIIFTREGGINWTGSYSFDGETWISCNFTSDVDATNSYSIYVAKGKTIYFKGNYTSTPTSAAYLHFIITEGQIVAKGNIMSLCDANNFKELVTIPYTYTFAHLFENCTALITPPNLPATELKDYCYLEMFKGCSILNTLPDLSAITLKNSCYASMFEGCSQIMLSTDIIGHYNIKYKIPLTGTGIDATNALTNMFTNTGGTFTGSPEINTTYYLWNYETSKYLCFIANEAHSSISMRIVGSQSPTKHQNFQTSIDRINWTDFIPGVTTILLANAGDMVYFRGNNPNGIGEIISREIITHQFVMGGSISVSGNIMALINNGNHNISAIPDEYCFGYLFHECRTLIDASQLLLPPTVSNCCYSSMFEGCSNLEFAPVLPATIMARNCYSHMFSSCISLENPPKLPAVTLADYCYYGMFSNCIALQELPQLPATQLVKGCYSYMFEYCTAIKLSTTSGEYYINEYRIPNDGTGITATDAVKGMFNSTRGTFTGTPDINTTYYVWENPCLCFTAKKDYANIKWDAQHYSSTLPILEFSTNNGDTWYDLPNNTLLYLNRKGDKIHIRGNNSQLNTSIDNYIRFELEGIIAISGNVMSLIDTTCQSSTIPNNHCFAKLFSDNTTWWTTIDVTKLNLATNVLSEGCYSNMFENCNLIYPPELPVTTLATSCYAGMFKGCTQLTKLPKLPATTLANYCYADMFSGCTAIKVASELPATSLGYACYQNMFMGCTSLIEAPDLPATTLNNSCYAGMFRECSSLISAPDLPATTLAHTCYGDMFYACVSLTKAPILPAKNLAEYCYNKMFSYCLSLTGIPVLPATTMARSCYERMFYGCTAIKLSQTQIGAYVDPYRIPSAGDGISATNALLDMFTGTGGTFTETPSINTIYYVWNDDPLCFTANSVNATVGMIITGTPTLNQNFQYSYNKITWYDFVPGITVINLWKTGDKVYFKGNNLHGVNESESIYYKFVMTGSITASGNIMSLIDNATYIVSSLPNGYCFYKLFQNCSSLTSAPILPAITLTHDCYNAMFYGCTALTIPPTLPATVLTQNCYRYMFVGCSSLIIPPELPATTLADGCYDSMFQNCTSLTTAPELPATTLAERCYLYMFIGCTSLTTVSILPATTLIKLCYYYMFTGCTSLQVNDSPISGVAEQMWRIPLEGTFTNTLSQIMFYGCPGTRSLPYMPGEEGQSYTYYTQNIPSTD